MRFIHTNIKLIAVGLICAAVGAGAGAIAVAGASTTPSTRTTNAEVAHAHLRMRALIRRTVQGELVVASRRGFIRVTVERGEVKSVSGQQLTLVEATRKAAYRTVQLTLPANAVVRDNHQRSALSQVKPGQRAIVIQAPKRTLVIARTPAAG